MSAPKAEQNHEPEQPHHPIIYQISLACTSCEQCVVVCPTQSIYYGAARFVIDTDTCDGHAICALVCPADAIHPVQKQGHK